MPDADDGDVVRPDAKSEDRFILYLRVGSGVVITLCIAFLVVVGTISGKIDATVIGLLSGAVLALAGLEVPKRISGNGK